MTCGSAAPSWGRRDEGARSLAARARRPARRPRPAAQLAEAFVRAGLEVEAVEQAGADVTGPLVVGRVLSAEPEQHKNGKTIHWCRSTWATTTTHGQRPSRGIVCGAHNFGVGDLVVVALPGAVLPGDFDDRRPQDLRPRLRRDDLLGRASSGLGDDHDGHPRARPTPDLVPGADAAAVLHLRETVLDIAVTPDRGYCLSIRGLAREAAQATGTAFTDPVDRPVPGRRRPTATRSRSSPTPARSSSRSR